MACTLNIKSHDVSEFYGNRLFCEIYLCTVAKTITFEDCQIMVNIPKVECWVAEIDFDKDYFVDEYISDI